MECERRRRVEDDSEVCGLNKWGNDNAIYGDREDFEMIVEEGTGVEQNKRSVLGLC